MPRTIMRACVPFPAPGGPNMIIANLPFFIAFNLRLTNYE